jgi:hypothetical protein
MERSMKVLNECVDCGIPINNELRCIDCREKRWLLQQAKHNRERNLLRKGGKYDRNRNNRGKD